MNPFDALDQIPREVLFTGPTPLQKLRFLSPQFGTKIWVKRDDLIGFALGGNKIRGLEFLIPDAKAKGADTFVTGAGPQSNHVRATAAAARVFGFDCTAVFWGSPSVKIDGNLRVTKMLGADIRYTFDENRASVDVGLEKAAKELSQNGKRPYIIPRGGACAVAALGHVFAVREIYQQCQKADIEPDTIVMAVGSGGTYAGWLVGLRALDLKWRILPISVSRPPSELSEQVSSLANETARLLGMEDTFEPSDIPVDGGYISGGYGIPSREGAEAIRVMANSEGILLDPTYTGKALAGFIDSLANERHASIKKYIFLHTGGEPAYFAGDGAWLDV